MLHNLFNAIYKLASAAGLLRDSSLTKHTQQLIDAFVRMTYLYGFSSAHVMKCLFQNDDASATAALDDLHNEGLIKTISSDQQRSGKLIKLTPAGADHAEVMLGQVRGRKYDTTSRSLRTSLIRHDLSSQLFACHIIHHLGDVQYLPEAALEPSKKTKYFDIIIMPESGQIVGVEIERTSKFGQELVSTMSRAIRAIRAGDVDFVVFVLPTTEAANRYDRVLDAESLVVSRKTGRRYMQDDVIDLTSDDLMRIVCVVGSPMIWKGAM